MAYNKKKSRGKHIVHEGVTYDSRMELDLHLGELSSCDFHNREQLVSYVVKHTYEPDFHYEAEGVTYLIESKGFFRAGDIQKYKAIVEQLPEDKRLVFILHSRNKPVSKTKRKDGTRRCMEDVITSFGCKYYYKDDTGLLHKIVNNE